MNVEISLLVDRADSVYLLTQKFVVERKIVMDIDVSYVKTVATLNFRIDWNSMYAEIFLTGHIVFMIHLISRLVILFVY